MTVRAMAQNRQPSGGYKQEPDNAQAFRTQDKTQDSRLSGLG
ncbi:hypothetical protein RB213_007754 [Colletotrichum asianum]